MRKKLYTYLSSDGTLSGIVVGGWHQPNSITSEHQPKKPFGIVRLSEVPFLVSPDADAQRVIADIYVYDRFRKVDGQMIASYLDIDSALERIYALMNRHQLDVTDYGWGIGHFEFDMTSEDAIDDGWNCIFKYSRYTCMVMRGR